MDEQDQLYLHNTLLENAQLKQQSFENSKMQSSMYDNEQNLNLIQWQLELDNILERIEHLLRGHELKFDGNGNLTWQESKEKENVMFNDYGVQEILRVLSMYLNRNTILSNYDEDTINLKMYDFGIEISDLIFMKYELMGLDNEQKIKLYPMVVRQLVDTVHSAYLRALGGGERDSLRTARQVTQTQPMGQNGMMMPQQMTPSKFSLVNPTTWIRN